MESVDRTLMFETGNKRCSAPIDIFASVLNKKVIILYIAFKLPINYLILQFLDVSDFILFVIDTDS